MGEFINLSYHLIGTISTWPGTTILDGHPCMLTTF